jgi:hypothetical protein
MATFGAIQNVLLRGCAIELEDEIAAIEVIANAERGSDDIGSVDALVDRKKRELNRLRELLA